MSKELSPCELEYFWHEAYAGVLEVAAHENHVDGESNSRIIHRAELAFRIILGDLTPFEIYKGRMYRTFSPGEISHIRQLLGYPEKVRDILDGSMKY